MKYVLSIWRQGLKIGFDATTPGLMRGRVMLLNGLLMIATFSVIIFSTVYAIIGYRYFYGPLYILPPVVLVLFLNHKGKFVAAQNTYLTFSLLIISYWCYEGRGNGNEYTLIALATTATLICDKRSTVVLSNVLCAVVFVLYKIYDSYTPFTPDPVINYAIVPNVIMLNTVAVISFQIAFFRDLAKHYNQKLNDKNVELQFAEEELKLSNTELNLVNEKLFVLTKQLESLVNQKTNELQTYINAIDVNLYSCINDLEGNFTVVNNQLVKASGYSREELIGKPYTMLTTLENQNVNATSRRETLMKGDTWRGEVEHNDKYGNPYWFDCVTIPVKDETGATKFFLSIGLPITERKMHEKAQIATYKLLENIAFRASHNIRGPLARIQGLANLLQMDIISQSELKTIMPKFTECSEELSSATSELVNFVHDHQESLVM
ncbi:MAG: PAS domain S-box protein [Cytophagia bacterium]|nr:PAS domain S-box protein [Cytophagia bacterium]